MQSSKEQPGEIRKPSSVINAKKYRKTTEWERLEILQENQRYQGNISSKDGLDKGQKWYGPNRNRRYKKKWQEYMDKLYKKKTLMIQITMKVQSITQNQTSWSVKLSGLRRITMNKVGGGDGIPGELFQILKDDAVKVLSSICQQI